MSTRNYDDYIASLEKAEIMLTKIRWVDIIQKEAKERGDDEMYNDAWDIIDTLDRDGYVIDSDYKKG